MATHILRRLIGVVPVVLLVTLIVFLLNANIPGDPGRIRLGQRADPAAVEAWNYTNGYLAPLPLQYLRYLGLFPARHYLEETDREAFPELWQTALALRGRGAPPDEWRTAADERGWRVDTARGEPLLYQNRWAGILQGDLGESHTKSGVRVSGILLGAFGVTARLAICAILVAVLLGVGAGIISAVRNRTWIDYASMVLAIVGVSMPVFWLGILLILYLAPLLGLPRSGFDDTSPWDQLRSLVLPALALGLLSSATIARLTRSAMLDVLTQDYVRTARAKGLRGSTIVLRHALRNAAIPIVTVIGNSFGYLLVGAVLTESVFALPGLGSTIVDSIAQRDRMVITGGILMMSIVFVVVNLCVDLTYGFFDPRVRHDRG